MTTPSDKMKELLESIGVAPVESDGITERDVNEVTEEIFDKMDKMSEDEQMDFIKNFGEIIFGIIEIEGEINCD